MRIPNLHDSGALLAEAEARNPGPWVAHSRVTARAADALAEHLPGVDPEAARILGLLHDIGRRAGVTHMRHIIDGYQFLHELGHEDAARICLTHSFPLQDIHAACGEWDCSADERAFVERYLAEAQYDAYDRLIQLCDACCLPTGCCLIEKRLVNVHLRYGVNEYTVPKWHAIFQIQQDLERAMGRSIYVILAGVVENTFPACTLSRESIPEPHRRNV